MSDFAWKHRSNSLFNRRPLLKRASPYTRSNRQDAHHQLADRGFLEPSLYHGKRASEIHSDKLEQEADQVANIVSGNNPNAAARMLQRMENATIPVNPASNNIESDAVSQLVGQALQLPGQPLDKKTRILMESRFHQDLGNVRIHYDQSANDSAEAINAKAYTVGRDIVFGDGQYSPETQSGQHLLAHELTHVFQQTKSGNANNPSAQRVQRQPDNDKQVDPADNIKKAVALLKGRDPKLVQEMLSKAPVDGQSHKVHTVTHTNGNTTTVYEFMLEVKVGAAKGGHSKAEFTGNTNAKTGTNNQKVYAMEIVITPQLAKADTTYLSRTLFHEGLHMQLFVDRRLPSSIQSQLLKDLHGYFSFIRNENVYKELKKQLISYIIAHSSVNSLNAATPVAEHIINGVIEEKFIKDETVRKGVEPAANLQPSALMKAYLSLTTRWLQFYLQDRQVAIGDENDNDNHKRMKDEITSMARKLVSLWIALDNK